jgi:hypothetical protein
MLRLESAPLLQWVSVEDRKPPINSVNKPQPYVLAIDAKDRMSVGYARLYSTGELWWTFAKPIGEPTHWMPLPNPPARSIRG